MVVVSALTNMTWMTKSLLYHENHDLDDWWRMSSTDFFKCWFEMLFSTYSDNAVSWSAMLAPYDLYPLLSRKSFKDKNQSKG